MIVGIGELLWDVFPDGRKVAGGAPFNFAFHCHQLGHRAVIVSRVGDDDLGRELREEVKRLGLSDEFIQTDREHPTGTVRVTVDANGQPGYEIVENVAWDFIEPVVALSHLGGNAKAITFGTLGSRDESSVTIRDLVRTVRTASPAAPRVFDVNIRQHYFTRIRILTLLGISNWMKVSEEESALLDGMGFPPFSWGFDMHWLGAGRQVDCGQYHRLDVVCETRGAAGCEVLHQWEVDDPEEDATLYLDEAVEVPAIPANVVDTVGAGDAFTAAMVCLHLEGKPLRDCARFANRYAARVCEHRGATPCIDRREIEALTIT